MNTESLFNVAGKTAVVTGGSRGIGAMITRGLIEHGAKVYITSRSEEECQATAAEFSQQGECHAIPADLSTSEGIASFADTLKDREKKLDILVNNAGISWHQPFEEFAPSAWDKLMNINLKAVFFLTQQLLPLLKNATAENRPSRVINIASIGGMMVPHAAEHYAYTTSKAGVIHLTRHLAMRLSKDGITVNAISPGLFPSQITKRWLDGREKELNEHIPLGRIGQQEDIAGAVIYLSSCAGAWLTGTNIPVDGGSVIKQ